MSLNSFRSINAVYYPEMLPHMERPPCYFDLSMITHVFYAFASIDFEGKALVRDAVRDEELPLEVANVEGGLQAWTRTRNQQYRDLKIILSIGGEGAKGEKFADIARDSAKSDEFADSVRGLVERYDLNGIDVDWEHPSAADQGRDFLQLLTKLRSVLPAPRYLLTTAITAGSWSLKHIDLFKVSQQVDLLNLMAYDFVGPGFQHCTVSGHHAQLWAPKENPHEQSKLSGAVAVQYILDRGVPASKLLFGIPLYGRSFLGATAIHQPYTASGGEFQYFKLPRPGTTEIYDRKLGAAYCVGKEDGFVSYDNPDSVAAKADFALRLGLAGLFYWHIGQDKREESLVETGYKALKKGARV